jgi:hypothetical protein
MNVRFSSQLIDDLTRTVQSALLEHGIVNVPRLAEEIRKRNETENVALEDIAAQLMVQAQAFSAAMEFDSPRSGF